MASGQDCRGAVGRRGEDIAARYLVESGHTVLARNWRIGHLEIDIITMAADGIHFVEVKSRVFPMTADPEENVGPVKRRRLVRAAGEWLRLNGREDMECHFDVAGVVFRGDAYSVRYIPKAFIPVML